MQHDDRDRTIALAGIFQAIKMVQQVARTGLLDQHAYEATINSVFNIDANSTDAVFGDISNITLGCRVLLAQLGDDRHNNGKGRDAEITRYAIAVMVLERKLIKHNEYMQKIADSITKTKGNLDQHHLTNANIIADLADIYTNTISTLKPRIIVNGEPSHISNAENANKIRALLLAAVRSAVLWRQCGGSRWQLLFKRNNSIREAQQLLDSTKQRVIH